MRPCWSAQRSPDKGQSWGLQVQVKWEQLEQEAVHPLFNQLAVSSEGHRTCVARADKTCAQRAAGYTTDGGQPSRKYSGVSESRFPCSMISP